MLARQRRETENSKRIQRKKNRVEGGRGRGGDKARRRGTVLLSPHSCSSQMRVFTKADSFRIIWF
jgi:hypothetical protein